MESQPNSCIFLLRLTHWRSAAIFGFSLLCFLLALPAQADVTARYSISIKAGWDTTQNGSAASDSRRPLLPSVMVVQVKGDRASSNALLGNSLIDLSKGQITILDPADRLFAAVSTKEYWSALTRAIPMRLHLESENIIPLLKTDGSCRKTGRTQELLNLSIEENECLFSLYLPLSTRLPGTEGISEQSQRMDFVEFVQQRWTASDSDVSRLPELAELLHQGADGTQLLNPDAALEQALASAPFFGPSFVSLFADALQNQSPILISHTEIYVPLLNFAASALQTQLPPDLDPKKPFAVIDVQLTELSDAPIDDFVFQVPPDYQSAPLSDVVRRLAPVQAVQQTAGAASNPSPAPAATAPATTKGQPSCRYCPIPEYSQEARRNQIEGTVVLQVVIQPDGHAGEITLTRGIGGGLDEKAIEAVKNWLFNPATDSDGKPIAKTTAIEINFRLAHP